MRVPIEGGTPTLVVDSVASSGFAWLDGGTMVVARPGPDGRESLWKVSDAGGAPTQLTTVGPSEQRHHMVGRLPGGKAVVFAIQTGAGASAPHELATVRIADGVVSRLGIEGSNPIYADGFLFFIRSNLTFGMVPFDPQRLRATGEPVTVPATGTVTIAGAAQIAENGTLIAYQGAAGSELVSVDRRGMARPLLPLSQAYSYPRLSPDGKRVAVGIGIASTLREVWVIDLTSGTPTKLSPDRSNTPEAWTPDGRRVIWTHGSDAPGLWWQPWDASAPAENILPGGQGAKLFPGGHEMITTIVRSGGRREVRIVPLPVDTLRWSNELTMRRAPGFPEPRASPDGKWIAYVDRPSNVNEVFVSARTGGRYQVSVGGGEEPVWSRDGTELFYRAPERAMMSAHLELGAEARVVSRDTLFPVAFLPGTVAANYDVTADGHFIIPRPTVVSQWPTVTIGWTDELREKLRRGGNPR
jgi:serine/threonine-protein kinase